MFLKIFIRDDLFYVNLENWDQNTPSNSPKAPGTKSKFGKGRVHLEVLSNSVTFMSEVLARQNSGEDHMKRPCTKKDAPAVQRGIWRKNINNLQNSDKTMCYLPIEDWENKNESGAGTHHFKETRRARVRS